MTVTYQVPTPLQGLTKGEKILELEAKSIGGVIRALEGRYPVLAGKFHDGPSGDYRKYFCFYINNTQVFPWGRDDIALSDGDDVQIIPCFC